ncbi:MULTISPECIES: hypothetical protein [unclassified Streptomyces]|uniref:hypothetical protein n=1 Tax=unclassified Streptomyces TaxID=2593676 RepID=UPI002E76AF9E|nr:hypothetical protein [Streptomyces sp. JV176]MEE1804148.1 hypothetical protein [Streptomyces sp. JV176]
MSRAPSVLRGPALYARSRHLPAALAGAALTAALAGWSASVWSPVDPRVRALLMVSAVVASASGLSGQDAALDRAAARRWAPLRAAHVALIGALAGAVLLLCTPSGRAFEAGYVVVDAAGAAGAVALGAWLWGGRSAWALPLGWCGVAFFVPSTEDAWAQAATWMLQPPGTTAAVWTAAFLAVGGGAAYALAGPRR